MRELLRVKPYRSELHPNVTLPCYYLPNRQPGDPCFWWEQRHFLTGAVWDLVEFRKQEKRRGILQRVSVARNLHDHDIVFDDGKTHMPLLLSTRGLVAWLLERFLIFYVYKNAPRHDNAFSHRLDCVWQCVRKVAAQLEVLPTITIDGVTLHLQATGCFDITDLARKLPNIVEEWRTISDSAGSGLDALPPSHLVSFGHLHRFVEVRIRRSSQCIPAQHPFMKLREAMLAVATWMVEVHAHLALVKTMSAVDNRSARYMEMAGRAGRYRVHNDVGKRMDLIQRTMNTCGSTEALCRATEGIHGKAAMFRCARNLLYERASVEGLHESRLLTVGVDGSCHGGPSVLVGYIADVETGVASYLRPEDCYSNLLLSRLKVQRARRDNRS